MGDQTTGPDASGDAAPDYAAKYNGLQQAFQKRTNEFAEREQAWTTEKADYEAKAAKLAEYEAREQAALEEQNARAEYEALQARFEEDPPTPLRHNEGASRLAGDGRDDGSLAYLERKLAKDAGVTLGSDAWPS